MKNPASMHLDKITLSLLLNGWGFKVGSILTFASAQECVIFWAHTALSVDPVSIISGGLDHSTDACSLKSALVQQGEWTSWGWWQRFDMFCKQNQYLILYWSLVRLLPQLLRTAVVHAVESQGVHLTEVKILSNNVVELRDFGGYCGNGVILVEREWPVVHDGLVVIRCVLICYEVVIVFIEVVPKSCHKGVPTLSHVTVIKNDQRHSVIILAKNPTKNTEWLLKSWYLVKPDPTKYLRSHLCLYGTVRDKSPQHAVIHAQWLLCGRSQAPKTKSAQFAGRQHWKNT